MKDNDYKGEIYYSEPKLNSDSNLYEVLKTDEEGNILDILQDENEDNLKKRVEEELKTSILGKINKKNKPKQTRNKKANVALSTSKDQLIIDILDLKLKGEQINDIINQLSVKYQITRASVGIYITEAMAKIREKSHEELVEVIESHVNRYEQIYKWLYENDFNSHLRKVLAAKESLLNVGSQITIDIEGSIISDKENSKFIKNDINLLKVNSQEKLVKLLKKVKQK